MIFIDSSIYINWLKRRADLTGELATWIRTGQLACCGVVRTEVLRGIPDKRQRDRIGEFFDILLDIPTDISCWRRTTALAWELDRQSKVLPPTDLVIAVCAMTAGAELITSDPHFQVIPGLRQRIDLPLSNL
jgi:predicted nucleic acid-binding protein